MPSFDAIVIGCGGVGSAALYHLARRGLRVLGLDQFPPVHDRGSSHGSTRIIRQAYFEHPDYVPLLLSAYELWEQLSAESGRRLLYPTGLLQVGPADGTVLPGVLASAARFSLPVEQLSATEAQARFPGFRIPPEMAAVYEPRAGVLMVEECVRAHLAGALAAGATIRCGARVRGWKVRKLPSGDSTIRVELDDETIEAARLVITAGPWAASLLGDLNIPLSVERRVQCWFAADAALYGATSGCPAYLFERPDGIFYGFPRFDSRGVKVAEHTGSAPVSDPLAVDRELREADRQPLESFLTAHLPGVTHNCTDHDACLYTLTPDGHFVIDRHPTWPQVVFAAGLSGHGFKFSSVLGNILADMTIDGAIDGKNALPIDFLSVSRSSLR